MLNAILRNTSKMSKARRRTAVNTALASGYGANYIMNRAVFFQNYDVVLLLVRNGANPVEVLTKLDIITRAPMDVIHTLFSTAKRRGLALGSSLGSRHMRAAINTTEIGRVAVLLKHGYIPTNGDIEHAGEELRFYRKHNPIPRATKLDKIIRLLQKANPSLKYPLKPSILRVPQSKCTFQGEVYTVNNAIALNLKRLEEDIKICEYAEDILDVMDAAIETPNSYRNAYLFVAREQGYGRVAAAAFGLLFEKFFEIYYLCSSKQCRGAGTFLLDHIETYAKTHFPPTVSHLVLVSARNARGFYNKVGWQRNTRHRLQLKSPQVGTRSQWNNVYSKRIR